MRGVSETMQVQAVSPCTLRLEKVFKSACRPAPAEQSEPAMVSAIGMVGILAI